MNKKPFSQLPKIVQQYIRGSVPASEVIWHTKRYKSLEELRQMLYDYPEQAGTAGSQLEYGE